jgi:putative ABC transport system permease protein
MDTIPEIEKYYSTNSHLFEYYKEVDQTISDIYYDFSNVPNSVLTNKYKSLFDDDLIFFINYVDDDDFNALCEANNINPKDYYYDYNNKLKAVVMNNISHKENSSPVFTDELKGITLPTKYTDAMLDDLEISTEEMAKEYFGESSFEFGDFVEYDEDNYLCNLNSPNCVSLYIPVSVYLSFQYDGDSRPYSYGIVTTEHKKVTDEINKYFQNTTDDDSYYALDIEYYRLQSLAILTLVKVLMYFFITFITIITASNIVNTISSSIHLRKKEFAMLQSVGVTPKGFKKMIALESVFYGIRGLIVGLPLSLLICFVMNKVTQFNTIPFDINIFMYLIVLVAVFVLVGATMLISVNKVKNDSIIDSLKTDIY